MASLLVRNVDATLVQNLRKRAIANGHSAEAEHRAILVCALQRPRQRSLAEV
ncbi:MAG: antitoxin, partial [Acidobacteriota bacterium]|nr:antitoxin [Acidobacteriota bacterium]